MKELPTVAHDADGDQIEVFLARENFYGERLSKHVTLYRSQKTREIVGILIDGVTLIMQGR